MWEVWEVSQLLLAKMEKTVFADLVSCLCLVEWAVIVQKVIGEPGRKERQRAELVGEGVASGTEYDPQVQFKSNVRAEEGF